MTHFVQNGIKMVQHVFNVLYDRFMMKVVKDADKLVINVKLGIWQMEIVLHVMMATETRKGMVEL